MDTSKKTTPPAQPQAVPEVRHAEPRVGGSFTRNPHTGALDKTEPAQPATQPDQE